MCKNSFHVGYRSYIFIIKNSIYYSTPREENKIEIVNIFNYLCISVSQFNKMSASQMIADCVKTCSVEYEEIKTNMDECFVLLMNIYAIINYEKDFQK